MAVAGSLTYDTKIDKGGFEKGLKSMKNISNTISNSIKLALGTITTAIAGIGAYAVKVGSNFEAGMSKVQAISGATGDEISKLTEKAKEMGQKTKFSATESAEAFQYMAMAGWKTEDMLNGIEGIMNLAAASGEDLASVSDIVTDALTAFGLQAKDSAHFADVLAKASSNSNTNVGLMGATFKYVAPIAGSMKYSIEDTAVAIGLMANAGIKGEQAGTALRAMLTRLVKPPKEASDALKKLNVSAKNSDGTMKPLAQTLQELRAKFANLNDSQKASYASSIAGTEAMSGMLAIVNASDADFNKLTESIKNSDGAAKGMADTMNDNVKGSITLLKSNLESVGIKIYEQIKGPLKNLIDTVSKFVSKIPEMAKSVYKWIEKNKNTIKTLTKVVASLVAGYVAYKTTLIAITAIQMAKNILGTVTAFISLIPAIKSAKDAMLLLNMAMNANPIGIVVAAVAALATGLIFLANAQSEEEKAAEDFAKSMADSRKEMEDFNKSIDDSMNADLSQIENVQKLKDELLTLADANGQVEEKNKSRASFILTELNKSLGTEYTMTGNIISNYKELQNNIDTLIEKKKAEIVLQAEEEKYKNAIKNRTQATEDLREAQNKLTDSLGMSYEQAKEKSTKALELQQKYNDCGCNWIKTLQETGATADELWDALYNSEELNNLVKGYDDATERVKTYTEDTKKYEEDHALFLEGKYNEIGKIVGDSTKSWSDESLNTIKESLNTQKKALDDYTRMNQQHHDDVTAQNIEASKQTIHNLANELMARTQTVEELSTEEIEAWKATANASVDEYSRALAGVKDETRLKIEEAVGIVNEDGTLQQATGNLGNRGSEGYQSMLDMSARKEILGASEELRTDTTVKQSAEKLASDVNTGFNDNVDGETWGYDLTSNISSGISKAKELVRGAVTKISEIISQYLHHTTPDIGPLKDDDKWTIDMMDNFITGIDKETPKMLLKTKKVAKGIKDSFNLDDLNNHIIQEMNNAVAIETGSINAKAILQSNREQPIVIARDTQTTINNTQNFYDKQASPYEQQRQSVRQLRGLSYGI